MIGMFKVLNRVILSFESNSSFYFKKWFLSSMIYSICESWIKDEGTQWLSYAKHFYCFIIHIYERWEICGRNSNKVVKKSQSEDNSSFDRVVQCACTIRKHYHAN